MVASEWRRGIMALTPRVNEASMESSQHARKESQISWVQKRPKEVEEEKAATICCLVAELRGVYEEQGARLRRITNRPQARNQRRKAG